MTSGPQYDLLGFGVAAADELIELDELPPPDVKVDLRSHETQCGGICVNALVAASRLGLRCHYVGTLGGNELSDIVRQGMDAEDVTYTPPIDDPGAGPSHAFIMIDRSTGTRTILMDKSRVREMSIDDLPDSLLRSTRTLYVDAWRMTAGLPAVQAARRLGVQVIADFEEYEPERVAELLPFVDHLILPHAYAKLLTKLDDPKESVLALAEVPRVCTAVTCGIDGCHYVCGDSPRELLHQPAFIVEVVDSTGCGDAFHGAYITAVLEGRRIPESISFAAAAAALSARAIGAQAGLPNREEVENLLAAHTSASI